jgi:SAM-dependent methyltransferase
LNDTIGKSEDPVSIQPASRADPPADCRRRYVPRAHLLIAVSVAVAIAGAVWLYLRSTTQPPDVRFVPPPGGHVMYVPTPQDVVQRMLESARVSADDVVYDLGCGDGRVVVTAAATYGCRGRGYDIDPLRVRESRENARRQAVQHLVEIHEQDIFELDLREADVVFLYLLPELNVRLIPQLRQLKPGARIISHMWDMHGVQPDQVLHLESSEDNQDHVVYLWTTPLQMSDVP